MANEFKSFKVPGKNFSVTSCLVGLKEGNNGFAVGFFSMGNTLYKVETSPSQKDGVKEWVKITKCKSGAR